MSDNIINTTKAPEPVGLYPHARKVGNLLFLSGIGPREAGTNNIPGLEVDKQGNFLTDIKRDFATYNRIYAEYFKENQPCRTTVGITSLPTAIAIELKCIAVIP